MSPLVRFIIFSTVFVKGASFISLPFLSIYLQRNLAASPAMTGLIVGLNPTMGMLVGFYGGYLSDNFGRRRILYSAIFICALCFFSFTIATQLWHFALANALLGGASGALQTTLRALVSDLTPANKRPQAFRLHYFAINVGASVGPLVGAALLLKDFSLGFITTGTLYFTFLVSFIFLINIRLTAFIPKQKHRRRLKNVFASLEKTQLFYS